MHLLSPDNGFEEKKYWGKKKGAGGYTSKVLSEN
jgi:hypothetical protein